MFANAIVTRLENEHGFGFSEKDREILLNTCCTKARLKRRGKGWYWNVLKNRIEVSRDDVGNSVMMVFLKYKKYYLNNISGTYLGLRGRGKQATRNQKEAADLLHSAAKSSLSLYI